MISKQEKAQFAKTTLEEAINEYRLGFLTATGLVRYWIKITMAYGWEKRIKPKDICDELGVSKSAFYKAIAQLKVLGYINFEVHGEMTIINSEPDSILNNIPTNANTENCPRLEKTVHDCGQLSTIMDSQSTIVENDSTIMDSQSTIVENETPKPALSKHSGSSPDLYQIYFKFIPSLLQETGEGESELICFFEWMDEHLWPTFDTPVKHPDRWLKSIDPETEQPRFWTQWAAYQFHKKTSERRKNGAICRNYEAEWQKVLGLSATMSYGQTSNTLIKDPLILEAAKFAGGLYTIGTADFSATPKHKAAFISKLRELDENATLSSFLPENPEILPLAED